MAEYSLKPLLLKLGIRVGQTVYFKNAPDGYLETLGPLPKGTFTAKKLNRPVDFIQCFYKDTGALEKDTLKFKQYLDLNGMVWVCWPKKTGKVKTDITEQTLRDILLPHNLVDLRVVSIDTTWSGLKFVWRRA